MMRFLLIVIPIFVIVQGCNTVGNSYLPNERTTQVNMNSRTYLALGDSYTIGEAVPQEDSFPFQLRAKLLGDGIELRPTIIATTGWTTGELISAIQQRKPANNFDLVTLLIGVNNQYRGMDIEIYKKEFSALLEQSITFAGGKKSAVVVVSIPDWGMTDFGKSSGRDIPAISKEIDLYNTAAKKITEMADVAFVDITPGSRKAASDKSLIAKDGLHPSKLMYQNWAAALLPGVRAALR